MSSQSTYLPISTPSHIYLSTYLPTSAGNVVGSTNVESALRDSNIKRGVQSNNARKRLSADQTVFYVYKGVKTFDYSEQYNVLVTGGMDRLVRIWNPYVNTWAELLWSYMRKDRGRCWMLYLSTQTFGHLLTSYKQFQPKRFMLSNILFIVQNRWF